MRSRTSSPSTTAKPSRLEIIEPVGSDGEIVAALLANTSCADCIYLVWKAPATASGRIRAPTGGLSAKRDSSLIKPAATIWPAPLSFAATNPSFIIASSTSSRSPPRTADIPVFSKLAAFAIAFARSLTKRIASNSLITFATAAAVISPTE